MIKPLTPDGGIGTPPPPTTSPTVDEGPMRGELLRQIRRLELETSRFQAANGIAGTHSPTSRRRGPAVLTTAQLEQVRDELLDIRQALHEMVVARAVEPDRPEAVGQGRARRGRRRGRSGSSRS